MFTTSTNFQATGLLANRHIQSILASSKLRRKVNSAKHKSLIDREIDVLLDAGDNIKLHCLYSPAQNQNNTNNKLVTLIHGWEGSAESTYLLSAASHLFNAGYSIIRLHLRDHGPSYHLNTELFHAARLNEVIGALQNIQNRFDYAQHYLVGFSLGGNFVLRTGIEAAKHSLDLTHIVAISPVFIPTQTMHALETGSTIYKRYFINKWKRTLKIKSSFFPERYNVDELLASKNLSNMTETLVSKYTSFKSVSDYFHSYTLNPSDLETSDITTDVILAADDPVIPLSSALEFSSTDKFTLRIFEHGGHCGFVKNWRLESWVDQELVRLFS